MKKKVIKTQIEVTITTRTRLKKSRLIDRESYDAVVNRSLDALEVAKNGYATRMG